MKYIVATALVLASVTAAAAQYQNYQSPYGGYGTGSNPSNHQVDGYTRNNGTYVAPHYQTNPNSTQRDNYGTIGNQNPYTGQFGTRKSQW
jgi:hypothetical protein